MEDYRKIRYIWEKLGKEKQSIVADEIGVEGREKRSSFNKRLKGVVGFEPHEVFNFLKRHGINIDGYNNAKSEEDLDRLIERRDPMANKIKSEEELEKLIQLHVENTTFSEQKKEFIKDSIRNILKASKHITDPQE